MEKELALLEKNCIQQVDNAFDEFNLTDLGEAGKVEDLIGQVDWYLFWLSNASEITWRINFMLENNYGRDLLLRAVAIKRVIDQNIVKYAGIDEIKKDLELSGKKEAISLIKLNVREDRIKAFLKEFYDKLISEGLTNASFSDFTTNFIQSDTVIPINWTSKQNVLLGLIKFLIRKGIINIPRNKTMASLIITHFEKDHKPLKKRSIEVILTEAPDDDKVFPGFLSLSEFLA